MRILLTPFETAGVAGALARALRRRHHDATLAVLEPHPFGFSADRLIGSGYAARVRFSLEALRADVLHFQYGTTPLEFIDAAVARVTTRPLMLMHYWGDDARTYDVAERLSPARARIWDSVPNRDEATVRRRMRLAASLCHAAVVSDLELADYVIPRFRTVYLVPTPVELPQAVGNRGRMPGGPLRVLHAPSESAIKGTGEIRAAVAAVAERIPLQARWITNRPRGEVLGELADADVVIDQLNSETTGVLTLEAMALGKPVLTEFRPERLARFARGTPAVQVTAASLPEVLESILRDPSRRAELGRQGQAFVSAVHAADVVAEAVERMYVHARSRPPGVFEVTSAGIQPVASPTA